MNKYENTRKNIKLIFYSVIQLVFLILLIYFSVIVFNSPDLNSEINSSLSIVSQEQRAIFLVSLSVVLFITIFIGYLLYINDVFKKKIINIIASPFSFIIGFYFLYKLIQEKKLKEYIAHEYSSDSTFKIFCFYKANNDKEKLILIQNTISVALQFCISVIAFSFAFVYEGTNNNFPTDSLILNNLTYFTEWGNIGSFIFMFLLVVTGHRFFFKNNSFTLAMVSYMSIIGIIFSLSFFFMISLYHTPFADAENTTRSIWFHFINPLSFILFCVLLLKRSNQKTEKGISYLVHALLMPAIYGAFVYSLPFFTNFSVYGFVTNLNGNIIPYYGDTNPNFYNGGWQSVFFLILIIATFFVVIILSKFLFNKNFKKWENHK